MQRHICQPRSDWKDRVERVGLSYHSHESGPYWDESACYELTAGEVDALEGAAEELHRLCRQAAGAVIRNNWWNRLSIAPAAIPSIIRSWDRQDFSLYGRFDLAYDGVLPPKLLEYNADTPTALVEAAIAQWFWLQDTRPESDQFNSIHERLIDAWKGPGMGRVHFSCVKDNPEDEQTVVYLQDTCLQAGLETDRVYVEDIGWDPARRCFVDLENRRIETCFKLYPWEWLWREAFSVHLPSEPTQFVEPPWKMLLSNKGLLPILWELFPDHPNLLPAYETPDLLGASYVAKPRLSREGANVALIDRGVVAEETQGRYGEEGRVFQALAALPAYDGNHPVCGVWVVGDQAAGLGIREDRQRITGNLSRFVPHFFPKA